MKITYVQTGNKKLFVFHDGEVINSIYEGNYIYLTIIKGEYIKDIGKFSKAMFITSEISEVFKDIRKQFKITTPSIRYRFLFTVDLDMVQLAYFEYCRSNQPLNAEIMLLELQYRQVNDVRVGNLPKKFKR